MKAVHVGKYLAVIDDCDADLVGRYHWRPIHAGSRIYAYTTSTPEGRERRAGMHELILGYPKTDIDHRDGDGLMNIRVNLRICSRSQNRANSQKSTQALSSQYKGVCWRKSVCKWTAQIVVRGHHYHLGYFYNEEDAALAYDKAAIQYFGEFSRLNFPGSAQPRIDISQLEIIPLAPTPKDIPELGLYTLTDAALGLGISYSTLRKEIRKGNLAVFGHIGRSIVIHPNEISKFQETPRKSRGRPRKKIILPED